MQAFGVFAVAVMVAACGGSGAAPELSSAPTQASVRANCFALDTTFRSSFDGPVYTECGVTRAARIRGQPRPKFDVPRGTQVCYRAIIEVVVDERGTPRHETARLVRTTDPRFARAILDDLRTWKYVPAALNGTPVPQLVIVDQAIETRVVSTSPGSVRPPSAGGTSC